MSTILVKLGLTWQTFVAMTKVIRKYVECMFGQNTVDTATAVKC